VIVVDASVLSAFILKEPIWRRLTPYLTNAVSIDLVIKEVSNAIWKACVLKGIIDEGKR